MYTVTEHEGGVLEVTFSMFDPPGRDHVSVYVVDDIIVDSASARTAHEFVDFVRELGARALALTHWHEDHAGGAAELVRETGMPVMASSQTADLLRDPPVIPDYRARNWGQIEGLQVEPVEHLEAVGDLRAVGVPGHSPDHTGFIHSERGWAFVGDLILRLNQKVAMPGEDPWARIQSLEVIEALDPELIFTGHRSAVGLDVVRSELDYLKSLAEQIRDLHNHGMTSHEIVGEIFGGEGTFRQSDVTWEAATGSEFSTRRWVEAFLNGPDPSG